jgi:hypothetical protein
VFFEGKLIGSTNFTMDETGTQAVLMRNISMVNIGQGADQRADAHGLGHSEG